MNDDKRVLTKAPITSNYSLITHQSTPSSSTFVDPRDTSLARGTELRASRKSVTFDTNLESVALYSPPDTPTGKSTKSSRGTTLNVENQSISRTGQSLSSAF